MRPYVSPFLRDSVVLRDTRASLGEPFFGPSAFLRDVELRLGLSAPEANERARRQAYGARLAQLLSMSASGGEPLFYARSFALDPQGTATTLLGWRDSLVEAGWDRTTIPSCGPRVDALVAAELLPGDTLPMGLVDRLARVELELGESAHPPYEAIVLLEEESAWSESWRRVLRSLELLGTRLERAPRRAPPTRGTSDLADAQRWVLGHGERATSCSWKGDGSLLLLSARTSWELGDAVAGLIRAHASRSAAIVRLGDAAPLDAAFARQGLSRQGYGTPSPLRGALQVVPLAMALLFSPRDPYRALELLTLPDGPISPFAARHLARAIGASPGIGSAKWIEAKATVGTPLDPADPASIEAASRALRGVESWFEDAGYQRSEGAPKDAVVAVLDRVAKWARGQMAKDDDLAGPAIAQAVTELRALVDAHPSNLLSPHSLDLYARRAVGSGIPYDASPEEAGRVAHVSTPHAFFRSTDLVIVWHAGFDAQASLERLPWRASEREALERQGLRLPDRDALMEADARAWRRVLGLTKQTFVVATPDVHLSDAQPNLPFWDEIVARCNASARDVHFVRASPARLLDVAEKPFKDGRIVHPVATALAPLPLPEARPVWRVDPALLRARRARVAHHSPSSLEPLFACPLRWVIDSVLRIKPGSLSRVPDEELLYGTIGHRLVEVLHQQGLLADPEKVAAHAPDLLTSLIDREGGPLLMPGRVGEREQVRERMLRSVGRLSTFLRDNQLTPTRVEESTEAEWGERKFLGRMDLLVERPDASEMIVDLKWGSARYRDALRKGLALQLALYAETRRRHVQSKRRIPAAYYSLKNGVALALRSDGLKRTNPVHGPTLEETWDRAEMAMSMGFAMLDAGEIHVSAQAQGNEGFLEHHGLTLPSPTQPYNPPATSACTYCSNASICGRKWVGL